MNEFSWEISCRGGDHKPTDLIVRSEEPELNEVLYPSEDIYERNVCEVAVVLYFVYVKRLLRLLLLGLVTLSVVSLAVIMYLCLMVLPIGNAGALSA